MMMRWAATRCRVRRVAGLFSVVKAVVRDDAVLGGAMGVERLLRGSRLQVDPACGEECAGAGVYAAAGLLRAFDSGV